MNPPVRNPFVLKITVSPEDIDAQGHVSNVKILEWANRAAIAHSDHLGFTVARYYEIGGIFVVRRHEIDYLLPAYEGEQLVLYTWPSSKKRSAAERRHEIQRESDGAVVARVLNKWVYVDTESGRPKRMHPQVAETFDPATFI